MASWEKAATEVKEFTINWASWLDTDEISTSSWSASSGITVDSDSNTTTTATVWLSGGTSGNAYTLTNTIVTTGGRTEIETRVVVVKTDATFTYLADLTTARDKVRFYLGDTSSGSGPRPNDGNFDDTEIDGLITVEDSWQKAVAAGFERLAAEWTRYPSFKADGLSLNRTDIAKGYREQALSWRRRYGGSGRAGSRAVTRVDGYSDDKDNVTD